MNEQEREELVIAQMMEQAAKYGLEHEVRVLYDQFRASGDFPEKAAWCALYEWDL